MPTANAGMLFMKKFAKCSAATIIRASGRARLEPLGHAAIGAVELSRDGGIGHVRASGDARGVARDPREYQAHTPATFSSIAVVMW